LGVRKVSGNPFANLRPGGETFVRLESTNDRPPKPQGIHQASFIVSGKTPGADRFSKRHVESEGRAAKAAKVETKKRGG